MDGVTDVQLKSKKWSNLIAGISLDIKDGWRQRMSIELFQMKKNNFSKLSISK